jgi:hypothetical protein
MQFRPAAAPGGTTGPLHFLSAASAGFGVVIGVLSIDNAGFPEPDPRFCRLAWDMK